MLPLRPVVPCIRVYQSASASAGVNEDDTTAPPPPPPPPDYLPRIGKTIGLDLSMQFERVTELYFSQVLGEIADVQWFDRQRNVGASFPGSREFPSGIAPTTRASHDLHSTRPSSSSSSRAMASEDEDTMVTTLALARERRHYTCQRALRRYARKIPLQVSFPCLSTRRLVAPTLQHFSTAFGPSTTSLKSKSVLVSELVELQHKLESEKADGYTLVSFHGMALLWKILVLVHLHARPISSLRYAYVPARPASGNGRSTWSGRRCTWRCSTWT